MSDNSNVTHEELVQSGSAGAHHIKGGVEYERELHNVILQRDSVEIFHEKRRILLDWKSLAEA